MNYRKWGEITLNLPYKMWIKTKDGKIILKSVFTPSGNLASYNKTKPINFKISRLMETPKLWNTNYDLKTIPLYKFNKKIKNIILNLNKDEIDDFAFEILKEIDLKLDGLHALHKKIDFLFLIEELGKDTKNIRRYLEKLRKDYNYYDFSYTNTLKTINDEAQSLLIMTDEELEKTINRMGKYTLGMLKNTVEGIERYNLSTINKKDKINFNRDDIPSEKLKKYLNRYLSINKIKEDIKEDIERNKNKKITKFKNDFNYLTYTKIKKKINNNNVFF